MLKHHPIREYLEDLVHVLFEPLIRLGYFASEPDKTFDRTCLYDTCLVGHVHVTGGKATHDAIVWGSQTERTIPKLQVPISSELGCVTPWIILREEFSQEELEFQAKALASAVLNNCSCNCNAPKVVVVSDTWMRKDEFLRLIQEHIAKSDIPPAYYPGIRARWNKFAEAYPSAKRIHGRTRDTKDPRRLVKPSYCCSSDLSETCSTYDGSTDDLLLPILWIDLQVDLCTEQGRQEAASELAFREEPFAPVLTVATIKQFNRQEDSFLDTAVNFANDYVRGTLSVSLSVPHKVRGSEKVQKALCNLQYGAVATNSWSAFLHGAKALVWGGYPETESLENIQSGLGFVHNKLFIPNVLKAVLENPCVGDSLLMEPDYERQAIIHKSLADLSLMPGLRTLFCFLSAQMTPQARRKLFIVVVLGAVAVVAISLFAANGGLSSSQKGAESSI